MAVAISGCVITKQNDTTMKYKKKCDKCGFVESIEHNTQLVKHSSTKHTSSFRCPKCKTMNKVIIQGEK